MLSTEVAASAPRGGMKLNPGVAALDEPPIS